MENLDKFTSEHPMIQTFLDNQVLLESQNKFSCKHCGFLCCSNKDIVLRPHDFARIRYFLQKNPKVAGLVRDAAGGKSWHSIHIGPDSGIPIMQLAFRQYENISFCPFIMPVGKKVNGVFEIDYPKAGCMIHSAKPGVCRLWPYGSVRLFNEDKKNVEMNSKYFLVEKCPGFDASDSFDNIPPGYQPPRGTVGDFIRQAKPQELEDEFNISNEIFLELTEQRLVSNSGRCKEGLLNDGTVGLLARLLYGIPKRPAPENEHRIIVDWLSGLLENIQPIASIMENMNGGISTEGLEQLNQYLKV